MDRWLSHYSQTEIRGSLIETNSDVGRQIFYSQQSTPDNIRRG